MSHYDKVKQTMDGRMKQLARDAVLVVTVDTEADDAWRYPERVELSNMAYIPRFQEVCERYGFPPTYLVAYECAARDEAVEVLAPIHARGGCEIGHHLHVWTAPPFVRDNGRGVDEAWLHAYQYELPDELFEAKADSVYEAIQQAYSVAPVVHRAGRWGVDQRTFHWLAKRGFVADTSVIPLRSMERNRGLNQPGPNFLAEPRMPHRIGGSTLWELPVTVDITPSILSRVCVEYLEHALPGSRYVSRLLKHRALGGGRSLTLDPRFADGVVERMMLNTLRSGIGYLHLALHSSELAPDTSPFTRTEKDFDRVWQQLERILSFGRKLGLKGMTLAQVTQKFEDESVQVAKVA